jgi:hypothetical protein
MNSKKNHRRFLIFVCLFGLISTAARSQDANSPAKPQSQTTSGTSFASSDADLTDSKWHFYASGYIWIPGIHGTVGVRGFESSVHLSAGDIFSNFSGGLLGVFTPTYNRSSAPVDFMWMRLKPTKDIPFAPNYSVQSTLNFSVITPKVSYLIVKKPKLKIYGTMGPRIWHLGATLSLAPPIFGYTPSKGSTWTDFVAGGRFSTPLGSKASVEVLGDAGGGGATLDYQLASFLNYQIKRKITVQGGWRYLTVHYGNNGNILNSSIQGILIGATYKFR